MALRDSAAEIGQYDAAVFYVSLDDPAKNAAFAKELGAKHVLLSDPSGEVAKAYGVLRLGGLYAARWTIYVDASGKVARIDKDVNVKTAGADIARQLGALGVAKRK
jgi:peroxiredoxin Q/BCP